MNQGSEKTAGLPDLYATLRPAQKLIVDRHMHLMQALRFPGIDDDVKFEHIRQTASSEQGMRILSEAIAATEAWKKDTSITLPRAVKMPKDAKDRHVLLLKRHKQILLAADPMITSPAQADSFANANTPAGLQMLEQLEFLRQHAEKPPPPARKATRAGDRASTAVALR